MTLPEAGMNKPSNESEDLDFTKFVEEIPKDVTEAIGLNQEDIEELVNGRIEKAMDLLDVVTKEGATFEERKDNLDEMTHLIKVIQEGQNKGEDTEELRPVLARLIATRDEIKYEVKQ